MLEFNGKRIAIIHYPKVGVSLAATFDPEGTTITVGIAATNEQIHEPICDACGQKIVGAGRLDQFNRKVGRDIAVGRLTAAKTDVPGRYLLKGSERLYKDGKFQWEELVRTLLKLTPDRVPDKQILTRLSAVQPVAKKEKTT